MCWGGGGLQINYETSTFKLMCVFCNILQLLISELKSFIQELKSQLTTLYHQFAPLPAPPEDDEQLREKLNRLYIGASSVTHKQKSPSSGTAGAAAIGDISSHAQQVQSLVATAMTEAGLPSQSSMMMMGGGGGIGGEGEGEGEGEEGGGACVCTAASHEGGEEMEGGGVPHYHTTTVTTGGNAGTVAPNDMHVSHITYHRVTVTNNFISVDLHESTEFCTQKLNADIG